MARTREFDEIEVLDKAVELFWQKGYTATSADDLVKGLGLSRSSIYSTFGNKRTLYLRALDQYEKRNGYAMIQMVKQSNDLLKTIEQLFQKVVEQDIKAEIPKGCFLVNTSVELGPHDQQIAKIVSDQEAVIKTAFEMAILKGQEKGQISKKNSAKSLARFLYNSISGLRVAVKSKVSKSTLDDIIKVNMSALK